MDLNIKTNGKKCAIKLELFNKYGNTMPIRIMVFDENKPNTIYADAVYNLNKSQDFFYIRLPLSPEIAHLRIYNANSGNSKSDPTFAFKGDIIALNQSLEMFNHNDPNIISFIKFASDFCENAGILSAGSQSVYISDDGKYTIKYVNAIQKDGKVLNTPAQISKSSKIITVSREKFIDKTVPARMAILFHEFGHGFLNKDIDNETEADINALKIYLGLGFSKKEAYHVFINVFKHSNNPINITRFKKIKYFIENFDTISGVGYRYYYNNEK